MKKLLTCTGLAKTPKLKDALPEVIDLVPIGTAPATFCT